MNIDWTMILKEVIPSPCYSRPFVCAAGGFPYTHDIIVVGNEVATNLETNWWSSWDPRYGFKFERFLDDYTEQRRKKRERTGKNIRDISNTRLRFNRVHSNGIKAVETNASKGDGISDSNKDVVRILLENMQKANLKAVVAHGKKGEGLVASFQSQGLITVPIFMPGHFYNLGYSRIDNLCDEIKAL